MKTPNIDRLARGGLMFDNTYSPTAKCAPSRSAMNNCTPDRWPCGDPELGLKDADASPTKAFIS